MVGWVSQRLITAPQGETAAQSVPHKEVVRGSTSPLASHTRRVTVFFVTPRSSVVSSANRLASAAGVRLAHGPPRGFGAARQNGVRPNSDAAPVSNSTPFPPPERRRRLGRQQHRQPHDHQEVKGEDGGGVSAACFPMLTGNWIGFGLDIDCAICYILFFYILQSTQDNTVYNTIQYTLQHKHK